MKFKKGQGGRKKGAVNKETKQLRQFLADVLDNNQARFEEELFKLKGDKFINAYANLLEYCTPKLQRTELTADQGNKVTAVFQIEGQEIPFEKK